MTRFHEHCRTRVTMRHGLVAMSIATDISVIPCLSETRSLKPRLWDMDSDNIDRKKRIEMNS